MVCRYLGDVLLATPLARSLHDAGYEVQWLVAPGTGTILEHQTFATKVHELQPTVSNTLKLITGLWKSFDVAYVIGASDRPMAVALCAAKQTYALLPLRKQDAWKRRMATRWIAHEPNQHIVNHAIALMELTGLPIQRDVGITWTGKDKTIVVQRLWSNDENYILIHPFARWPYKHWPEKHWQLLMAKLVASGYKLVITSSPFEYEKAKLLTQGLNSDQYRVLDGTLSWAQLAYLSHQAMLYVGLDTANTHLAASTGTPVLAIYGPTNPQIWGPWPNGFDGGKEVGIATNPFQARSELGIQSAGNVHIMQSLHDCVPCQLEGCERHRQSHSACLDEMQVERVLDKALSILNKKDEVPSSL